MSNIIDLTVSIDWRTRNTMNRRYKKKAVVVQIAPLLKAQAEKESKESDTLVELRKRMRLNEIKRKLIAKDTMKQRQVKINRLTR